MFKFTAASLRKPLCQAVETKYGPEYMEALNDLRSRLKGKVVKIGGGRVRGVVEHVASGDYNPLARIRDSRGVQHLEPVESITAIERTKKR